MIGKVMHEFSLCSIIMSIYNEKNEIIYTIEGPLYQMGIWTTRFCTCEVCQKAFFFIKDKRENDKIVGLIEKVKK